MEQCDESSKHKVPTHPQMPRDTHKPNHEGRVKWSTSFCCRISAFRHEELRQRASDLGKQRTHGKMPVGPRSSVKKRWTAASQGDGCGFEKPFGAEGLQLALSTHLETIADM